MWTEKKCAHNFVERRRRARANIHTSSKVKRFFRQSLAVVWVRTIASICEYELLVYRKKIKEFSYSATIIYTMYSFAERIGIVKTIGASLIDDLSPAHNIDGTITKYTLACYLYIWANNARWFKFKRNAKNTKDSYGKTNKCDKRCLCSVPIYYRCEQLRNVHVTRTIAQSHCNGPVSANEQMCRLSFGRSIYAADEQKNPTKWAIRNSAF